MLTDYSVHPSLASHDVARARDWYRERLGLEPMLELPGLLAYQVDQTIFTVFETPAAGTAQNTVAIWRVPDLRAEVARLRGRGVAFEELDLGGGDRTIDGIATTADSSGGTVRNAWFRDGDGNWTSMVEQPDHPGEPNPGEMGIGLAIAVADLARARQWYAEKLGLEPLHVLDDELVYRQGTTGFTMFESPSAGTARNTVGVWRVEDLRSEVAGLRSRGLVLEDVELGDDRTVDGVYADPDDGTLMAWFADPDGNVLGLVEDHGVQIRPR